MCNKKGLLLHKKEKKTKHSHTHATPFRCVHHSHQQPDMMYFTYMMYNVLTFSSSETTSFSLCLSEDSVIFLKMLSKRRSSEAVIQGYLKESATVSDAALILGTGTFYKKGFGINNWKLRGYFIKGDKKVSVSLI